ncbi:uncharacterized protein RAG0_04466 [Rhynchosporium agropyri]|uniref:Transcription factor domain-containing protein n=1 Tax=Rhynchosporium agropyri TaxID=914238 RepID=A0A1E1K935_9HELO|nr:uncharacterized protein RAG0_04466 [Rhynchosporium agropyri]
MAATFKFISLNHATPKRLQSSKACGNCRRRKKRCIHGDNASHHSTLDLDDEVTSADCQETVKSHASVPDPSWTVQRGVTDGAPQLRGRVPGLETDSPTAQNPRFIGDLNPESIFLAETSNATTRGVSLDDSVGVWLNTSIRSHGSQNTSHVLHSPSHLFYRSSSIVQKVLVPMLEQECISTIPCLENLGALIRIYFDKIYPIVPFVSERMLQSARLTKLERVALQQGICLAASKDITARKYLTLSDATPLSCREFGERLSGAMRIIIETGLITDKIVLIQIFALLSQFIDDPPGEDLSSQYCMKAVHQAQSLGLHIKGQEEVDDQGQTTMLCCIWAMDRMNAAFKGRPVTMHERDLRKDLGYCLQIQDPAFRLFLEIVTLLDKVIGFYRPQSNPGDAFVSDMEFPAYEDIVLKYGGSLIGMPALESIEVFYHSVAILSCRTRSWMDPERSSTAFLRQGLSTSALCIIFGNTPREKLSFFPFIPYGMSLTMSIVYREMRYSKLSTHRARARNQFQILCDALSGLEDVFGSALTTAAMGRKLLQEMDRVSSTIPSSESLPFNKTPAAALGQQHQAPREAAQNDLTGSSNLDIDQPDILMCNLDFPNHGSITDINLFGLFDPAFDLEGFDAYLEGNINPGFISGP